MSKKFGYRADIDVLRAIAVLPVVFFHLDSELIPGGFLGVDVFFVISGYLITRLLKTELDQGGIDLLGFWRRRILRILPALITMVFVTFLIGQSLLFAPERDDLAVNSWAALLSVSNISHWLNYGGYWGADAGASPLLHTWSLGVEEQFYLFYPLFLLFLFRCYGKIPVWVIFTVLLVSLGGFAYGLLNYPSATFYLLPTRAWELAAGATSALLSSTFLRTKVANGLSFAGLVLVITAYIFAEPNSLSIWNVIAVTGATLIVYSGGQTLFSKLRLTNKFLLWVGLISYSLYLWHYPVVVYEKSIETRYNIEIPVVFSVSFMFLLAWLSYRFIETPLRRAKSVAPKVGVVTLFLSGLAFGAQHLNYQEDLENFKATQWAGNVYSVNPSGEWPEDVVERMRGIEVLQKSTLREKHVKSAAYLEEGVVFEYGEADKIDVLVLGDSHALQWAPVIDEIMREIGKSVSFMTADGTPAFFNVPIQKDSQKGFMFTSYQLNTFKEARLRMIRERKPKLVIISAAWRASHVEESESLVAEIVENGSQILLIGDPPKLAIGDRNAPQYLSYLNVQENEQGDVWLDLIDYDHYVEAKTAVKRILGRCEPNCRLVDPSTMYIRSFKIDRRKHLKVVNNNEVLYIDDDHLSVAGAKLSKEVIREAVLAIFPEDIVQKFKMGEVPNVSVSNE